MLRSRDSYDSENIAMFITTHVEIYRNWSEYKRYKLIHPLC